jgi:FkbM family methyltransferase
MQQFNNRLARTPVIGAFVLWLRASLRRARMVDVSNWLRLLLTTPNAQIVQIGANDGMTGDPISTLIRQRPGWRALFVEPVPYMFARLQRNYGDDPRFTFENVAVAQQDTRLRFYWLDEHVRAHLPTLPPIVAGISSLDKSHILKHTGRRVPDAEVEPYIMSQEVETISLNTLLSRNHIAQLDLLHIDAEGYDYKILSQLDLTTDQPRVILFEHSHLSAAEKAQAQAFLSGVYRVFVLSYDILAVHRTLAGQRGWRLRWLALRCAVQYPKPGL